VPLGWVINIHVISAALDGGNDLVAIHDGPSTAAPSLGTVFGMPFTDVMTTRANATFRFFSNFQTVGAGAQLLLTVVRQPSICDAASGSIALAANQVLPFTTNTGSLYANSAACMSVVTAPPGYAIGILVGALNLELNYDFVSFFDGASSAAPLLLPAISGSVVPALIASSGQALTVRFASSLTTAFSGMQLVLQAIPQRDMCADQTPIVLGASNLQTSNTDVAFSTGANWLVPVTTNAANTYAAPSSCTLTVTAPAWYIA